MKTLSSGALLMSAIFMDKESRPHLLVQDLKNKADRACASGDRATCGRWIYQLLDILDTRCGM